MSSGPYAKNWLFTLFDKDDFKYYIFDMDLTYVSYLVAQREICPRTLRPHVQGYLQLRVRKRLPYLKSLSATAHWQAADGTPEENWNSSSKERTRDPDHPELLEIGTRSFSGKRSDLDSVHDSLREGITRESFIDRHFSVNARYPRLYERYHAAGVEPRSALEETKCTLIYGPPGTGKSRLAHHKGSFSPNGFYVKSAGKWWDGYIGQRIVLFDDFGSNSMSFKDFKRTVDRYPLRVEVKGSDVELAATEFYITSNELPHEWWAGEKIGIDRLGAITRRITSVIWFLGNLIAYEFPTYKDFFDAYQLGPDNPNFLQKSVPIIFDF